jgi:hypothetical protein
MEISGLGMFIKELRYDMEGKVGMKMSGYRKC